MRISNKRSVTFHIFWLLLVGAVAVPSSVMADLDDEVEQPKTQDSSGGGAAPSAKPTPVREGSRAPTPSSVAGEKKPREDKAPATDSPKPGAAGSSSKPSAKGQEPVKFQSSGLTGFKDQGTMELVNDVVITQGDTKMEADRVKAFYDGKSKEVVKIIASGNVKIFKDDVDPQKRVRSTSQEAVFFNKDRKVVLKGNPQLIRAGGDIVRGKEITYELDTGWMRVDRVEGVLVPQSQQSQGGQPQAATAKTPAPSPSKTPGKKQ